AARGRRRADGPGHRGAARYDHGDRAWRPRARRRAGQSRDRRQRAPRIAPVPRLAAEALEEVLHAVTEGGRAVLELSPGVLGLGLGGPPRLLDLVARRPRALDHGRAHALGGVLDPFPGRLRSALDLARGVLHLGVVRRWSLAHQDTSATLD